MKGFPIYMNQIKRTFTEQSFNRGQAYFNHGRVQHLVYQKSDNYWYGHVRGNEVYSVEIQIIDNDLDYSCQCLAYQNYGECKHVVACLFEIERRQGNRGYLISEPEHNAKQYRIVNQFINSFANFYQSESYHQNSISKDTLQVEFIVKATVDLWTIELKVGVNRTYVVKKIKEFLKAVIQQKNYFFTPNYSYEPMEQVFTQVDSELIQLLIKISNNEEAFMNPYFYHRKDERVLNIPPMVIDELMDKLQKTNYTFESDTGSYKKVEIIEEDVPFHFSLEKGTDDDFQLNIEELTNIKLFERYHFALKEHCLYKLTPDQENILAELTAGIPRFELLYSDHPRLDISGEQMEEFLSVVIPELKKVSQIEIAEDVNNKITQHPLHAKLLIDEEEGSLLVDLEYHYGDSVITPFDAQSSDNDSKSELMIRDIRKEQEIMSMIENASVKFNGKKLYIDEEEDIYYFLYRTLPFLEEKAEILLTSTVKRLLLPEHQNPETRFDFNQDSRLLEVTFDMKGIAEDQIQQILEAVIEKRNYYRLPDGAFVSIEENEQFKQIKQLYADLDLSQSEVQTGKVELPIYRALQVDDMINDNQKNKARISKQFRRLIQTLKNPDELDFDIPDNLKADLRDYQEIGFRWLKTLGYYALGGILADDMGLGKTLQSIAFLLSEKNDNDQIEPALIVAPASLVYNWKIEFEKFAPNLTVEVVVGSPSERAMLLENKAIPDVYITSYPMLRQDIDWYKEQRFSSFFLDEAQAIKNAVTKTAKAVRTLRAQKRFALSGTPIENSLNELWSIFQAILPGFFPSQTVYRNLSEDKISKMASPFILRRLKRDVLTELPDKIESTHVSELSKEQKELYLGYLARIQSEAKHSLAGEGLNKSRIKILAGLTRLRQLCCHPSLFIENYEGTSGKLEQLLEIISHARENNKRMLIFSQFTSMLGIIREELNRQGITYFYLDGQTPSKERVETVERFNQGENDIFLISLKAGGTGLNLTGADTVILYDLWWNPAVEEQATGRAHRMGQKNVVQVIRMLTKGTIEEKIDKLQQSKKELIEKVIQPGESMLSSMTEDEIRELLNI